MWNEKRINRRITVSLPINYETIDIPKKMIGHTVSKDISEGGLKILLERFYPPHTKFLIRLNINQINRTIESIAETVWSFNMHSSNQYLNGLRFIDLGKQNQNLLKEYIFVKNITD